MYLYKRKITYLNLFNLHRRYFAVFLIKIQKKHKSLQNEYVRN